MKRGTLIAVGLVLAALIGLYLHGSFDRPLSSIGLNFHECARNGLGATFCGKELDEYRRRLEGVKQSITHAKENLEETGKKSREESKGREENQAVEAAARRNKEMRQLIAKMSDERRIYESEPETSVAGATAKGTYEADRAQLQQLDVEQKNSGP